MPTAADTKEERDERTLNAMRESGVQTEVPVYEDYFGTDTRHQTMLPDGISWVEHKELTEGERKKIQNDSNRDVRLQRVTGDALIRSRPGDERHALLDAAITGWNLRKRDVTGTLVEVPFNKKALANFLDSAPPKLIDAIQKDIYKFNPWLLQDLSVEDIDKQIEELQEMRAVKEREEEGKDSSRS